MLYFAYPQNNQNNRKRAIPLVATIDKKTLLSIEREIKFEQNKAHPYGPNPLRN